MKIYIEPNSKREFNHLPNPWRIANGAQVCGLTDDTCVRFGWTIAERPDYVPPEIYEQNEENINDN